jgi:general secretion pathway protein G
VLCKAKTGVLVESDRTRSVRTTRSAKRNRKAGFTLIEILVVVAIIATLATIVGPSIFRNVGDARTSTAKSQIELLSVALNSYRLDNDSYPSSEQGLASLRTPPVTGSSPQNWRGPYLTRVVPMDPWGRPYMYVSPGRVDAQGFDLYTLGKDGKPGGDAEDEDITSWGGPVEL